MEVSNQVIGISRLLSDTQTELGKSTQEKTTTMGKSQENQAGPSGQNLIETVVALTGLPPHEMQSELNQILQSSGHEAQTLTLDELRAAMIAYLEQFAPVSEDEPDASIDESGPAIISPAN